MAAKPPQSTANQETSKVHFHDGFNRIRSGYTQLHDLVSKIQSDLKASDAAAAATVSPATTGVDGSPATAAAESSEKNYKRAVDMLVTDIKYIMDNIDSLENSGNVKRADVLLQFLMDATKKRTAADFKKDTVNLKKLLQIIAKLKLWVPPKRPEDEQSKSKAAAKKEESPFVSSKEKDNAATAIVRELFGLRCNQWGLDGLLKSYGELTDTEKLCLLCFSAFECEVEKVTEDEKVGEVEKVGENEYMISKSLKIKKRILIHWWVAEGLIDLHWKSIADSAPPNPNPNPTPEIPNPNSDPPPNPQIENSNSIPSPNYYLDGVSNSNSMPIPNPDQSPQPDPRTVEEIGEEILKVLKEKGFIDPVIKAAQESSRVVMHPFVHSFVTALAKRAGFFDFSSKDGKLTPSFGLSQRACLVKWPDKQSSCKVWETYTDDRNKLKRFETVQTLFNVNEPIIDIKPEWFSKMTNLSILHLGSWRSEAVEHIEVEDTKFMEDLKTMVKMRLFSLQGVSTIMKLSDSVCKLQNLVILDLRECHNLEELPVDIGCLKSLTHLDITNCHLLTKLPKGISLLSKLEVLKGFVIYDQAGDKEVGKRCFLRRWCGKAKRCVIHEVLRFKNKEECTLKDLEKLKELRQLSIVVNVDEFPTEEEVQVFREMRKLRKLKIAWEKSFKKVETAKDPKTQSGKCGWCCPCKKQDSENPSATGAGKPDTPNAGAQQESSASGSPAVKKPDSESPSATEARKREARNADAQQESSASCCLNLKCCSDSGVEKPRSQLLDQIQKLELWCFPGERAPAWLHPDQLTNLKKLYIKGGVLGKVPGDGDCDSDADKIKWKSITMLRLKYLPKLEITWLEFKAIFPNLEYLEKFECGRLLYFPCDQEGVWLKW